MSYTRSVLIALCLLTATAAQAAPITYQINGLPGSGSVYGLTGHIETDGTIGALGAANILSWSWSLTVNGTTQSDSSAIPNPNINLWGNLAATADNITLTASSSQLGGLELFHSSGGFFSSKVGFYFAYSNYLDFDYRGLGIPQSNWVQFSANDDDGIYKIASVAQPNVFSVPEPSSAALVLVAAIAMAGSRRQVKRRVGNMRDVHAAS